MPSLRLSQGLAATLLVLCAQVAFAESDPVDVRELISKVSDSLRTSNFRGRLTYEYSGKLEIIEIAHTVVDGIEHDRVSYLNGPDRGLVKNGLADCLSQGRMLMRGGKIRLPEGIDTYLESNYSFKFLGSERVASRDSWVVQVVPKDNYRHSIILAVDKLSFLPTKTLFVSNASKVLERLHFVALQVGDEVVIEDSHNTDSSQANLAEIVSHGDKVDCAQEAEPLMRGSIWQPSWVPPGFVLSRYTYSDIDGHMETYTDGLVSFSVFTKTMKHSKSLEEPDLMSANYRKGATAVIMRLMKDIAPSPVHVAVLGEIPAETASRILSSVKPSSGS